MSESLKQTTERLRAGDRERGVKRVAEALDSFGDSTGLAGWDDLAEWIVDGGLGDAGVRWRSTDPWYWAHEACRSTQIPTPSPDRAERLLADPKLRAIHEAFGWVTAQEEGYSTVAHGIATAVQGGSSASGDSLTLFTEQFFVGWWLGYQILWAFGAQDDDLSNLGLPEGHAYGESPEQWIAKWREALGEKKAQTKETT